MRISKVKSLADPFPLPPAEIQTSIEGRKKELGLLIQAALKVGADLAAREAGRRAYAEFVKLDRDLQPAPAVPASTVPASTVSVASSGQLLFTEPKRRRTRAIL